MKFATTLNDIIRVRASEAPSSNALTPEDLAIIHGGSGSGSSGNTTITYGSHGGRGQYVHVDGNVTQDHTGLVSGASNGPSGHGEAYDQAYADYPRPETQQAYDQMIQAESTLYESTNTAATNAAVELIDGNVGAAARELGGPVESYNNLASAEQNFVNTGAAENQAASDYAHVSQQMANGHNYSPADANMSNHDGSPGVGY